MEKAKHERTTIKGQLTRFATLLNQEPVNVSNIRVRLQKAELLYDKYETAQSIIELAVADDEDALGEQEKDRATFESNYYSAIAKARGIIERANGTASRASADNANNQNTQRADDSVGQSMNVKKLEVPTFNEKLHCLNQSVTGEAKRAIAAFTLTADNYAAAWETLKSRYEDENELLTHHVRGLFEAPAVKNNSQSELRLLIDTVYNHLKCLSTLEEPVESWNTLIMYLLWSKLNADMKREWEKEIATKTERVTLSEFKIFLERHCKYLYKTGKNSTPANTSNKGNKPQSSGTKQMKAFSTSSKSCVLCKGEHAIYACEEFKKLPASMRIQRVREHKLCYNCLSSTHQNMQCTFGPCKKCRRKHNSLLHLEKPAESPATPQQIEQINTSAGAQKNFSVHSAQNRESYVLLATARIYIFDKFGNKHECRVLLDQGSQPHITTELCQRLGLSCKEVGITLSGIEQGSQNVPFQTTVKISSRVTDFTTTITCLVLKKISDELPTQRIASSRIDVPKGIELADPAFDQIQPIDMLLGTALFYELLCVGQIKLKEANRIFRKLYSDGSLVATCSYLHNQKSKEQLLEKDPAEQHFRETITRDETGRFVVSIPFKETELSLLGLSREMAYKRLLSIEKRLDKYPELKKQYVGFMQEYERLGDMTEVPPELCDDSIPHYYLPHHSIINGESTTTPVRVFLMAQQQQLQASHLTKHSISGFPSKTNFFLFRYGFESIGT
ncbi:uncharacterized protein LOC107266569 [Cephus cinctus]|uniref:Uncharacterized protein LOC107266569 n=1 Tax=Cephus cinctus TaxID=211228 RepID=A0AAJ7W0L3_CEPCN|nr:uncharacterized protein LOC107266569 [Cephus cinctus]